MIENNLLILDDIEVDLHEMCNLKCVQCTHTSPYFTNKDQNYPLKQFEEDITNLSKICKIKSFRIVGGEPFLNKDLDKFINIVKQSKIATVIKIFTNGLLLEKVDSKVFETMIQEPCPVKLKISLYSNLDKEKVELIHKNIKMMQAKYPTMDIVPNELTHFLKFNLIEENKNEEVVEQIYKNCYYSYNHRGFSFFNGRIYKCFASRKKFKLLEYHNKLTEELRQRLDPATIDSIPITETLTSKELAEFLKKDKPLEGCKWCLGTCGKSTKHEQISNPATDFATIEDLDFETGSVYMSNVILSWDRFHEDMGDIKYNKFFKMEYLKYYTKFFKFKKPI